MSDLEKKTENLPTIFTDKVTSLETTIKEALTSYSLPTDGIFTPINERIKVFKNLGDVVSQLPPELIDKSIYVSKFVAATAGGLFDAALNYLWDETILQLREKISQYDLSFFFDQAIPGSPEKRKKFKDFDDLKKLDDSELILGAKSIDLISDVGYQHLVYIKYMRNWVSAAHPNQSEITGLQLISWLETCIKEVISLPLSSNAIEIKRFLVNLKSISISPNDAKDIGPFFLKLEKEQINSLIRSFFSIYCSQESSQQTIDNIQHLLPFIKDLIEKETRNSLGIKYGKFVANNDAFEKKRAKEFLEIIESLEYIPEDLKGTEIDLAIDNLLRSHNSTNNFYNEPFFASNLAKIVGDGQNIPQKIESKYILILVNTFLSNGNGIAYEADSIYLDLLSKFNSNQALKAVLLFQDKDISAKLQLSICKRKYIELLNIMKDKISSPLIKELIEKIKNYDDLHRIKFDSEIKRIVDAINKLTQ